jgi:pyridoxal phosphate enzyme (YggS family)
MVNEAIWRELHREFIISGVTLVAVSKTKPVEDIKAMYALGQRDFGENYVQELVEKQALLPKDIRWHFIGHLQSNKVKYIAPFVYLIHTVDSFKLLHEINKQALKNNRIINVLLQVYIAEEETKFGLDGTELPELLDEYNKQRELLKNIQISGLMAMTTNTEDKNKIGEEFAVFNLYYTANEKAHHFTIKSIGMSSDYKLAIEAGSNMVRIGSLLFGQRGS